MRSSIAAAAAFLSLTGLVAGQDYGNYSNINNDTSSDCPTQQGAHIIVARASLEPLGYGIIGVVKDQILAAVPGSTAQFTFYPATLSDYVNSEIAGVAAMRMLIEEFVAKCPDAPMVIMGYSQGAQVTGDSLVGQADNGFGDNATINTPQPESTLRRVVSAIMMGDPALNLTASTYAVGTAPRGGIFPRQNNENYQIAGLAERTQSYCDDGDPYCAFGNNLSVHLGYVREYGMQATEFSVAQIKSFYANMTTSTTLNDTTPAPEPYTGSASSVRGMSWMTLVPSFLIGAVVFVAL